MNKVAHYLQQHLSGEILTSADVLDYFSRDESILEIRPQLVIYPRNENDIRKTARFTWQLAERGRVVPMTARGMGTDQTGASLGSGIVIALPAHLNKIIELDPKSGVVTAEAGIGLSKLQQVLHTHGRFLPPVSAVNEQATLGGAVSNNDTGRKSYKYGPLREFVRGLRVVLANGELIETGRLSKRELNKKLGLASFEGELYRTLDKLIEDSKEMLEQTPVHELSNAGFNIKDVKQKDGSFDLTPLFLGGQGTLGVITEVTLDTEPYNPTNELMVVGFSSKKDAWSAIEEVNKLKDGPASVDFIDVTLIENIRKISPHILQPLDGDTPDILLFIEIDDDVMRTRKKISKKLKKIFERYKADIRDVSADDLDVWLRLRDSASLYLTHTEGNKKAVPLLDDAVLPVGRIQELFQGIPDLMNAAQVGTYAIWGQAGSGLVHVAPLFDIAEVGERQRMFKLMDTYYDQICTLGGSIAGEYGEGRLRGALLQKMFQPEVIELFAKIKKAFDPHGTLNPGVKIGSDIEQIKPLIRRNYSLQHQYLFLPRS